MTKARYTAHRSESPDAFAVLTLDTDVIPIGASKFSELHNSLPQRVVMTQSRGGTHVSLWLDGSWRKVPIDETGPLIDDLDRILAQDIAANIDQFTYRP